MSKHRADTPAVTELTPGVRQAIKNLLHDELAHMISDVEFRLGRMAELERRIVARLEGDAESLMVDMPKGTVYAEDIVTGRHQITGYTVTANSPSAGSIAWTNVHVVYNGVDYTCADGNTALKYVYFVKPGSGTSATLSTSNTKPDATALGVGGALIFVNNAGTPISVLEESYPSVVGNASVDTAAIIAGAVDSTALGSNAVIAGKIADGAVNTSAKIASGIVAAGNLASGAVTAQKLSIAQHVLY